MKVGQILVSVTSSKSGIIILKSVDLIRILQFCEKEAEATNETFLRSLCFALCSLFVSFLVTYSSPTSVLTLFHPFLAIPVAVLRGFGWVVNGH